MHWIASTLYVRSHSWDALVALDLFIDLMFNIQMRKSKKKTSLFFIDCDLKMAGNGTFEAHILSFSRGSIPRTLLEACTCGNQGHGQV